MRHLFVQLLRTLNQKTQNDLVPEILRQKKQIDGRMEEIDNFQKLILERQCVDKILDICISKYVIMLICNVEYRRWECDINRGILLKWALIWTKTCYVVFEELQKIILVGVVKCREFQVFRVRRQGNGILAPHLWDNENQYMGDLPTKGNPRVLEKNPLESMVAWVERPHDKCDSRMKSA